MSGNADRNYWHPLTGVPVFRVVRIFQADFSLTATWLRLSPLVTAQASILNSAPSGVFRTGSIPPMFSSMMVFAICKPIPVPLSGPLSSTEHRPTELIQELSERIEKLIIDMHNRAMYNGKKLLKRLIHPLPEGRNAQSHTSQKWRRYPLQQRFLSPFCRNVPHA